MYILFLPRVGLYVTKFSPERLQTFKNICALVIFLSGRVHVILYNSNMTSFKRFESKPVVKIILIYDRLNLKLFRFQTQLTENMLL
jgi:hypothetical protein